MGYILPCELFLCQVQYLVKAKLRFEQKSGINLILLRGVTA